MNLRCKMILLVDKEIWMNFRKLWYDVYDLMKIDTKNCTVDQISSQQQQKGR